MKELLEEMRIQLRGIIDKDCINSIQNTYMLKLDALTKKYRTYLTPYSCIENMSPNSYDFKGKILVWSGDFLSKVDLSEIDFRNVAWSPKDFISIVILSSTYSHYIKRFINGTLPVKLKNTNAKIDFSTSLASSLFINKNSLYNCDFSGTDLSFSHGETITTISVSDLSNTNFKVNPYFLVASQTNFTGVDLSSVTIYYAKRRDKRQYPHIIVCCDVKDTGLCIDVNMRDPQVEILEKMIFHQRLDNHTFDGCKLRLLPSTFKNNSESSNK